MARRIAILFDIDGTLIDTGGAGAASWRLAFDELYGIPADIGKFTDSGMTDPDVGHKTFEAVLERAPDDKEFTGCSSGDCTSSTRRLPTRRATGSCPA